MVVFEAQKKEQRLPEPETQYDVRHRELVLPVVRIQARNAIGSGTVIASRQNAGGGHSTYVLTNQHVVDGLISVQNRWSTLLKREVKTDVLGVPVVEFFEYRWASRNIGATGVEADIVAYDKDEDLALLKLRRDKPAEAVAKLYQRGHEHELRATMGVYCVGAGLGEPPVITAGMISQFNREIDNREYWLTTALSIFGNSGGALFVEDTHEFIGVPARIAVEGGFFGSQAITHLSYAIPITRVWQFLEDQRFRFIEKPDEFTEQGEEAERKRLREREERRMMAEETAMPPLAPTSPGPEETPD